MSTQTIETFFAGKTLVVPSYQRDYAWRDSNVSDLFDDLEEAIEVGGGHYFGTFILCQPDKQAALHVVDGQQRLTTLIMLIDALIDGLKGDGSVDEVGQFYRQLFIDHPVSGAKFRVLGTNEEFFRHMLAKKAPEPDSDGQERMLSAYRWIHHRILALRDKGGPALIKQWLSCVSQMEVLQFIETSEGKAIRMFQSVNDRGVPLAKMDIVKSLLVYYSNRFLEGDLDSFIAQHFGSAFRSFSQVKRLAAEPGYEIRQINRSDFGEDDMLRYHYLAFNGEPFGAAVGDFWLTAEGVLEEFLKPALKNLRDDVVRLRAFIEAYVSDLVAFFENFEELIQETRTDTPAYLLWVIQDLSVTLYPLVVRLRQQGWLRQRFSADDPRTLMDLIEVADLRVFKLRGTNPKADIFRITRDLHQRDVAWVANALQTFCAWGMPDSMMASRLIDEDIYRNPAAQRMLLEDELAIKQRLGEPALSQAELVALYRNSLTVEHILPQEYDNSFNPSAYGFATNEDYERHVHRLGNLVLLEKSINSACRNQAVESKMTQARLYPSSLLTGVKSLAASCAHTTRFNRDRVVKRSEGLAVQMVNRWPIRQSTLVTG